jgi:hypothetical protein
MKEECELEHSINMDNVDDDNEVICFHIMKYDLTSNLDC